MSYIRSTSNPESLYIWGEENNITKIMFGPNTIGTIPTDAFNKLIDKYVESRGDDCEVDGLKIQEQQTNYDEFKMRLSYNSWYIDMWDVTWEYIARTNYGRSKPGWIRRIIKLIHKI